MKLRTYQKEAVDSAFDYLCETDGNPCIVLPTGAGKSLVIATIAGDAVGLGHNVLVLAHVRELVEQNADKIDRLTPAIDVGIFSAGMGRQEIGRPITVAGIQSVYSCAAALGDIGLVIIDEAQMIPPEGDGMYRTLLKDLKLVNPQLRVVGLTATDYRTKAGRLCGPEQILTEVCYEAGVADLMAQGYLSTLRAKSGSDVVDTKSIKVRGGEYVQSDMQKAMDTDYLVESACAEIVALTKERKSVLIFSAGIEHGQHIVNVLRMQHGIECGFVDGAMPASERDETLRAFKEGRLKYLCNVNVLTTGFDAPQIDCVALLRTTLSPGLYYQMVGRGLRLADGKEDCLILDYGENIIKHGPIDAIQIKPSGSGGTPPAFVCPNCKEVNGINVKVCPGCGWKFEVREKEDPRTADHYGTASTESPISEEPSIEELDVRGVEYFVHTKRDNPDAPKTMRVEYCTGLGAFQKEWVCFSHKGYARRKAERWWRERSDHPIPATTEEAVALATDGALCTTEKIKMQTASGQYPEIVDHLLGDKPRPSENSTDIPDDVWSQYEASTEDDLNYEDIPF